VQVDALLCLGRCVAASVTRNWLGTIIAARELAAILLNEAPKWRSTRWRRGPLSRSALLSSVRSRKRARMSCQTDKSAKPCWKRRGKARTLSAYVKCWRYQLRGRSNPMARHTTAHGFGVTAAQRFNPKHVVSSRRHTETAFKLACHRKWPRWSNEHLSRKAEGRTEARAALSLCHCGRHGLIVRIYLLVRTFLFLRLHKEGIGWARSPFCSLSRQCRSCSALRSVMRAEPICLSLADREAAEFFRDSSRFAPERRHQA